MTVAELIAHLQTMPQDLPVWSFDPDIEPLRAPVDATCIVIGEAWLSYPLRVEIFGDVGLR